MLSVFIAHHRGELILRCQAMLAQRHAHASAEQLKHGVPLLLTQPERTLAAEGANDRPSNLRTSGGTVGNSADQSEMGVRAASYGKELRAPGFSIDQVVHNFCDICRAVTDLAVERDAPFTVAECRTLDRCLDTTIADAVHAFTPTSRGASNGRPVA